MVGLENLALALAGIDHRALGIADDNPVRDLLDLAAARGVRAVQLSAAAPGARPRDLDRSGRRDLAAAMRRRGLALAGVDLWIPREHLLDPAVADRALSAIADAIDFAGELAPLAGLVPRGDGPAIALSVALPAELAPSVRSELDRRAQSQGVALADHTPAPADGAAPIGTAGVDPAALLAVRRDPAGEVIRLGPRLGAARLSDLSDLGLRVVPGEPGGRLDLLSYGVALVTAAYPRPVPIDLRGVADQPRALEAAIARFIRSRAAPRT
jgi:sugar phosphate isomerase/epimerase